MLIYVNQLMGFTIQMEVEESLTVLELKEEIQGYIKMPPTSQEMVFKGDLMEDELTLADYKIVEGSWILVRDRYNGSTSFFGDDDF